MSDIPDRTVLVFDVLGTLVDQTGSLERQVSAAAGIDDDAAADLVRRWLGYVSAQEEWITSGRRSFVPSEALDAEALADLRASGLLSSDASAHLLGASERLSLWEDTLTGLDALAAEHTVVGLSNASLRVLIGLSAGSGMRWHGLLSAEDAGAYKPDPDVYRLALARVAHTEPPIMVAAHAWDLRAARAAGMRTAHVPRPNGDPPAPGERFDVHAADLVDLAVQLRRP